MTNRESVNMFADILADGATAIRERNILKYQLAAAIELISAIDAEDDARACVYADDNTIFPTRTTDYSTMQKAANQTVVAREAWDKVKP